MCVSDRIFLAMVTNFMLIKLCLLNVHVHLNADVATSSSLVECIARSMKSGGYAADNYDI